MLFGAWANWGMIRKLENIANPTRKPVRLVAATERLRSTCKSISGCSTRPSTKTNTATRTRPPPIATTFAKEPQPHSLPCETPSRIPASAPERITAPIQSTRASRTGGDGGTSRYAANAAGSAKRLIQNSHWRSRLSTITPESGRPMPPPMPKIALIMLRPPGIWSRGNVSRTIPKASGKTPPATPCSTRPAITTSIEPASALITAPKEKITSTAVRIRPLP